MRPSIENARFPAKPGIYVVFENADDERPLYVGVAARQTLHKRWRKEHLSPRSGSSALRRSLGVHLGLVEEKLQRPDRYYEPEVEQEITRFLRSCRIEFATAETEEDARRMEVEAIAQLDPLLNVVRPPAALPKRNGRAKDPSEPISGS